MITTHKALVPVMVLGLVLGLFATQASAQVFVSGGPTIYKQNGAGFTAVVTVANANFESLAIGPDNADTDANGNAVYPFLLYACDTALNQVIRINASAAAPTVQTVASGLAFPPICGRSTATEDAYVTNKSGPGVFQLIATFNNVTTPVGNIPFSGTPLGASAVSINTFKNMTGRGITQKYIGDLLVVDNANNQVLRSVYATPPPALFSTLTQFITSNLNGPVGIANAPSLRQEFVANSNSAKNLGTQPAVTIFDSTGAPAAAPCSSLSLPKNNKQVPDYLASAPAASADNSVVNDTIYLVTNSNTAGTLWTWNTAQGNCALTSAASIGTSLSGVAVAPAPVTLILPVTATVANPVPTPFSFNSSQFQLTAHCTDAIVTASPLIPATVNAMISLAGQANHEFPAVNLGEQGYEMAYTAHPFPDLNNTCSSVFADGSYKQGISAFVDSSQFNNPRYLDCSNTDPNTEPQLVNVPNPLNTTTCTAVQNILGVYPLSGPIPLDGTITGGGGTGTKLNFFAVVGENFGAGTGEPGAFCGYQNPLLNPGDPGYPQSFSGFTTIPPSNPNTVNVKFKLADLNHGGTCKNGPFITDARALISVAKVQNSDGTPTFIPINVLATSSSLIVIPLYNEGNNQYSFTLNLTSTFDQGGLGTYSLTTTFLSDNTFNQTILFVLKP